MISLRTPTSTAGIRRLGRLAGAGIAVAVACLVPAGARALAAGGTWGTAEQVPGLPALSSSAILSVSCASPGNCSAGGYLAVAPGGQQAMVVDERNGSWGNAEVVPGSAALNTGGEGEIDSVSCASPGNCSAAGEYATPAPRSYPVHSFVVSERNGTWGKARKIPGLAALGAGQSRISSVSCASPGNCSAGGGKPQGPAFVVSQVNGKWGQAEKVPGLAAADTIGVVSSVSCASPRNCSAGGYYVRPPGTGLKAFAVSQHNGTWGTARQIPGMSQISSLSCASAANCTATGGSFAVSKVKGKWGKAAIVPGLAALSRGGHAFLNSVSCASPGNCSAGGYISASGDHAFLASQHHGTWGKAAIVPGLAGSGLSFVNSVSCGAAGNCSAGGSYLTTAGRTPGFVVSQVNGKWGQAEKVPGLAALNKDGSAAINSLSCASAGNCSAGGYYSSRTFQAFVVSQTMTPAQGL